MAKVKLYHPELKVEIEVNETAAPHHIREGGWQTVKPKPAKTKKKESTDGEG